MLLYWQFNTEPKCGRRKQEQPRRCAPHIENLVTVPSQQSAQRSTSNTEAYRQSQHRTPHHNPRTQNFLGTTFHIQHRSIQTKVNTAPHPHNPRTPKKKPEGCAEGPWLYGPFAVFHSFPKQKKTGPLPRK